MATVFFNVCHFVIWQRYIFAHRNEERGTKLAYITVGDVEGLRRGDFDPNFTNCIMEGGLILIFGPPLLNNEEAKILTP